MLGANSLSRAPEIVQYRSEGVPTSRSHCFQIRIRPPVISIQLGIIASRKRIAEVVRNTRGFSGEREQIGEGTSEAAAIGAAGRD